jgi:phosphoribosylglycinamide formyltransferase 1
MMKKIVVLASGSGSNLQSIIEKCKSKKINAEVSAVISDNENAFALQRARNSNIPTFFVKSKGKQREEFDKEVSEVIDYFKADLIVLAGFMRILSSFFVKKYKWKIINIHPALLPSFPGTHGYEDAWNYGVKVSGCTIHFVDEGMDTGQIIVQKVNEVKDDDTLESFKERGLKIEHEAFPEAIRLVLEGKTKIEGRRVRILK